MFRYILILYPVIISDNDSEDDDYADDDVGNHVMRLRRWCWQNIPVSLAFCLCKAEVDVDGDGGNESALHDHGHQSKGVDGNKSKISDIVNDYLLALLSLRSCYSDMDQLTMFPMTENEFLQALARAEEDNLTKMGPRKKGKQNGKQNGNSIDLFCFRLLGMGIMFKNVQYICQSGLMLSSVL